MGEEAEASTEVVLVEVALVEVASAEVGATVRVVAKTSATVAKARARAKVMASLPSMSQASASTPQLKAWKIISRKPVRSLECQQMSVFCAQASAGGCSV